MSDDRHDTLKEPLWVPRPVEETLAMYADWAATYDADVTGAGYATPARIANALDGRVPYTARVLDFGCGTGLSGLALKDIGFTKIDGTDISAQMLDFAQTRAVYGALWQSQPGTLDITRGTYDAIVATGVISLGAAPPETLDLVLSKLAPGGLLALSFNDPTIAEGSYDAALQAAQNANTCTVVFRENGPHLPGKNMGSDVMVLRRQ